MYTSCTDTATLHSTELWRDEVILEALRIYRARTEGASLDTVPEVTFSQKPSCDGRADKSVAQRGIMGFEPAHARRGYIYNPDRNPNLLDMPAELPDRRHDLCLGQGGGFASPHTGRRVLHGSSGSSRGSQHHNATAVPPAALKRKYMCSHCGVLKKGHVCPKATPKKRKGSSVRAVVKRARK